MKRIGLLFFLLTLFISSSAQTLVSETINISQGQKVIFDFPYAKLVDVRGWDQDFISIEVQVSINMGNNDDAYSISSESIPSGMSIKGSIKDHDKLPKMIQIKKGDQIYYFDTDDWNSPKIIKFYEENGRDGISWNSHGVIREIKVLIKVPGNIGALDIESRFGMIDIEGLNVPIKANSRHGGIDLSISAGANNKFTMDSKWGTIYTNLNLDFRTMSGFEKSKDWSHVECSINGGGGHLMDLESRHANIYLRKQ